MNRKLSMDELNRMSPGESLGASKLPVLLLLDNVRSMLNVGAVFRNADAFAASGLVLCGITACPPAREIRKTALGAEESVHWQYFADALEAAVEQATNSIPLDEVKVGTEDKICLIFGNEVEGVQQSLLNICHGCIEIPQSGAKHSLNVSVSSGVVLWHYYAQLRSSLHG
jgi:tRNA G18 (ribose-2'-O)-methylase SpoU